MPEESATLYLSDTRKLTLAAVNKATSYLKNKQTTEITLILGSKPQPRNKNAACHHCLIFKGTALCQNLPLRFILWL